MKNLHFIALTLISTVSYSSLADEFTACKSDLTKQMKRFEKTAFTVPRKIPSGDLKEYAIQMEIFCPWQIEIDLNGDKQIDWVGVIHKQKKYELVAYISGTRKYTRHVLHVYDFFPEQSYLKVLRNPKYSQNKLYSSKYHLAEVALNETSRVYAYRKDKMSVIHQYLDETPKSKTISPEKLMLKRKKALMEEIERLEQSFN